MISLALESCIPEKGEDFFFKEDIISVYERLYFSSLIWSFPSIYLLQSSNLRIEYVFHPWCRRYAYPPCNSLVTLAQRTLFHCCSKWGEININIKTLSAHTHTHTHKGILSISLFLYLSNKQTRQHTNADDITCTSCHNSKRQQADRHSREKIAIQIFW